jgi:hypothetical protein
LVGKRCSDKGGPRERKLLERGKTNTTDNWEQSEVNYRVINISQEQCICRRSKYRLTGFNNLKVIIALQIKIDLQDAFKW